MSTGLILGIESSCDETAAAVARDGRDILSSIVYSQHDLHGRYGGVVPELAGRAHTERITVVIEEALQRAGVAPAALDAVAVTHQPGLVGALLVGLTAAKMLALAWRKPLVGVHHIHAHLHACRMAEPDFDYPAVGLVASGGHTALYDNPAPADYRCLGATIDDAAGETFDKVASLFRLGYPGGPIIDTLARRGDARAFAFPRSFPDPADFRFSFSGLKTAVLYAAMGGPGPRDDAKLQAVPPERVADLAASFQTAIVETLARKLADAARLRGARTVLVGGGVACNSLLRRRVRELAEAAGLRAVIPPPALCTDNAAMIAGLGHALFAAGRVADPAVLDAVPTT